MRSLKAFLIASIIALLSSCGGGSSSTETTSGTVEPLIINGAAVAQTSSPQIVEVLLGFADGTQGVCSGTVLDENSVLTAGHCLTRGALTISIKTALAVIPAASYVVHPGYREDASLGAIFNDAGIIKVSPTNLPALPILKSVHLQTGDLVSAYGFGLDENGELGTLKSGETTVASVTPNHIFGSAFDGNGTDPCNGDSGGPLVKSTVTAGGVPLVGIVGIVSTGTSSDCSSGDATLYTNIQNDDIINFILAAAPGAVIQ